MRTRSIGQTGIELTELGLGCAALGNLYQIVSEPDANQTLETAWSAGIRYFDTAPHYGHGLSEQRLGRFLSDKTRDSYCLSTKVGRTLETVEPGSEPDHGFVEPLPFRQVFDYSESAVKAQVEDSSGRLKMDRFDILYVHDVGAETHGNAHEAVLRLVLDECLPTLQRLKEQGITRAIGIGVNEIAVCLELLRNVELDVILLAGRYTLLEQDALIELLPLCEKKGTCIVIGGPYNSGLLVGESRYNYAEAPQTLLERRDRLAAICSNFDVELAEASLQFPLAHPAVVSVIPGARSPGEVRETMSNLSKPIPAGLWQTLKDSALLASSAPTPT